MSIAVLRQQPVFAGKDATAGAQEMGVFAAEAEVTWSALNSRFGGRLSLPELDYLYAVFILGLTSPAYGDREPEAHLEICRALLELRLSPERTHKALHAVPEQSDSWVMSAFEAMERRGTDRGLALVTRNSCGGVRGRGEAEASPATGTKTTGELE